MSIEKLLIANRGEIALRIHRACHEMGIRTVAVHSTADTEAMHVRLADEAICIGPPAARDSYLNIPAIISAAEISGADAIHPGYGFLSENAQFAEIIETHGFIFVGPKPEHIRIMGDKVEAKRTAGALGLPLVPGTDGAIEDIAEAKKLARDIGLSRPHQGRLGRRRARHEGGARGGRVREPDVPGQERGQGGVRRRHRLYGEISRQSAPYRVPDLRRRQGQCHSPRRARLLAAAPPPESAGGSALPVISSAERDRMGGIVAKAMADMGYRGAGTIEFLYEDGEFYFIEMNTRIQVEHPVTEMITGFDLVREQIRIADGLPLSVAQEDLVFSGHAIECRINAEGPGDIRALARQGGDVPCPRRHACPRR